MENHFDHRFDESLIVENKFRNLYNALGKTTTKNPDFQIFDSNICLYLLRIPVTLNGKFSHTDFTSLRPRRESKIDSLFMVVLTLFSIEIQLTIIALHICSNFNLENNYLERCHGFLSEPMPQST